MAASSLCVSSEFDIFADRPVQTSTFDTPEITYKPITSVDQSDQGFMMTADNVTHIELNWGIYVKGHLVGADGAELDNKDFTAGVKNFLHSLFSQCNISLNGVSITTSSDNYNYRAYFETLLTYGDDAAESHLTNAYWYKDEGDLLPCDPTGDETFTTNKGFFRRWDVQKQRKVIQILRRLDSDICNVTTNLLPVVRVQVKLTKAKREFYLMNKDAGSKLTFRFLDAQLLVKRVKAYPAILAAHNTALQAAALAKYNLTRVEIKTFTFATGSRSVSIDNAIFGTVPYRLLITIIRNTVIVGAKNTSPYALKHYDISNFSLYVNGTKINSGVLALDTGREKTTVMCNRTLSKPPIWVFR
jgi:hypothetical protein